MRQSTDEARGGRAVPFSAERVRDRRRREAAAESRDSSRPGSPEGFDAGASAPPTAARSTNPRGLMGAAPSTAQQWQGYVLKAQQGESSAREEVRRLQQQLDKASQRHVDELAEQQRQREELRGQLEVRQFALQHATEARDQATARAEAAERELSLQVSRLNDSLATSETERRKFQAEVEEAQTATHSALEQSRLHAERALQQEHRAGAAEKSIAMLRFSVDSLEVAKVAMEASRDRAMLDVEHEKERSIVERALLRSYASESEQRIASLISQAEKQNREAESVEATLTGLVTAAHFKAEQDKMQHEKTVAQLRGHILELEEVITQQQQAHEMEMAAAADAHAREMAQARDELDRTNRKCDLLSQQLNALAEAAQQIKAERGEALARLAGTNAELERTCEELETTRRVAEASAKSEAEMADALAEVRAETLTLSDQLHWLETIVKDANTSARPLLAGFNQDHVPILDADAAYADERMRWQAGTNELHSTVTQLCGVFGWLAGELQTQLASSESAGSAASPAAELHSDLAEQIATASAALPSTFAPKASFERARATLVEAVRAQAQLASQSVSHLISCAADAERVATLQAQRAEAHHERTVNELTASAAVAIACLSNELGECETIADFASSLAWQLEGGLRVHSAELQDVEASLHAEGTTRVALDEERAQLEERLEEAGDREAMLRTELTGLTASLAQSREREAALEASLAHMGHEGRMNEDELLLAVRQAEQGAEERAAMAAMAIADASAARGDASLEAVLLRDEIRYLEGELQRSLEKTGEAERATEAREGARAAAHALYEREAARSNELSTSLESTTATLQQVEEECASATASAKRHAEETVEWANRVRVLEATAEAEGRRAASREETLAQGVSELDGQLRRVNFEVATARAQTASLQIELKGEERMRHDAEQALEIAELELRRRREEEEYARQERANAKAARQALEHASLQRELRQLQRQLVYPALTLGHSGAGGEVSQLLGQPGVHNPGAAWGDTSSEALWAGLLAEPAAPTDRRLSSGGGGGLGGGGLGGGGSGGRHSSTLAAERVAALSYGASDDEVSELQQRVLAFASDTEEIAPSAHAQHERMRAADAALAAAAQVTATPVTSRSARAPGGK